VRAQACPLDWRVWRAEAVAVAVAAARRRLRRLRRRGRLLRMRALRAGLGVCGTARARRALFVVAVSARRLCLRWSGAHGVREEQLRRRASWEVRWWGVVRERLRMGRWRCGFGGWEAWFGRWIGVRMVV
jgi:hypothetical protein